MKYTITDVYNWMMEQPDERPLNMLTGKIDKNQCGCLLSEFLKDNGKGFFWHCVDLRGVVFRVFLKEIPVIDIPSKNIFSYVGGYVRNFKQAKESFDTTLLP
jgi:hypothetical protein